MICPHCSADLRRRDRTNRRCARCRRSFALEPQDNPLHLHDLRMRRLAEKLSQDGSLRYTDTQLWYAASRKAARPNRGPGPGIFASLLTIGVVALGIGAAADITGLFAVGCVVIVMSAVVGGSTLPRRERPAMSLEAFRATIVTRWIRLYGAPPVGLVVTPPPFAPQPTRNPRAVLVCTDPDVVTCLRVNGAPKQYGLLVTSEVDQLPANLPPNLPVLVLHDASVPGCLELASVRRAAAGRQVVDLGIRPQSAKAASGITRIRQSSPQWRADELAGRRLGLTEAEVDWLAKGWSSPVGAIPPAKLIYLVADAVDRLDAARDPDRGKARAIGFMSWPSG